MYYIEKDNEIILFNENRKKLENTILFKPELKELEIKEVRQGYTIVDFELMTIDEAQQKQQQKERNRINQLFLTAADVERAIYKVKGIDFEDIINIVQNNSEIDLKALKIELKANNFYRGNPYVDVIGNILGFSKNQLDEFFKSGDYKKLQ